MAEEKTHGNFSNSSLKAINRVNYQPIMSQAQLRPGRQSPYMEHLSEDQFGQRGKPIQQTIAAEITVHNRNSKVRQKSTGEIQKRNDSDLSQKAQLTGSAVNEETRKIKASKSPTKPQYDTRKEDGSIPNANQKKSYNQQFEFFTKPLGPGHYEPSVQLTKPKSQAPNLGAKGTKHRNDESIALKH